MTAYRPFIRLSVYHPRDSRGRFTRRTKWQPMIPPPKPVILSEFTDADLADLVRVEPQARRREKSS